MQRNLSRITNIEIGKFEFEIRARREMRRRGGRGILLKEYPRPYPAAGWIRIQRGKGGVTPYGVTRGFLDGSHAPR